LLSILLIANYSLVCGNFSCHLLLYFDEFDLLAQSCQNYRFESKKSILYPSALLKHYYEKEAYINKHKHNIRKNQRLQLFKVSKAWTTTYASDYRQVLSIRVYHNKIL